MQLALLTACAVTLDPVLILTLLTLFFSESQHKSPLHNHLRDTLYILLQKLALLASLARSSQCVYLTVTSPWSSTALT
jgi:hypothetical protein